MQIKIEEVIKILISKGDIFYVCLSGSLGSEQGGVRPCLIAQNDIGNRYSPTTIIFPLTSQQCKKNIPTHLELHTDIENGLEDNSLILGEQPRTIDKIRLREKIGTIKDNEIMMNKLNEIIKISFGL